MQQICTYLEVEIGRTVIVVNKVLENLIGSVRPAVKGSVDELHLHRLFIEEIPQLAFNPVHIQKPHRSLSG